MASRRTLHWLALPLALLIGLFALGGLVRSCESGDLPALTATVGELLDGPDRRTGNVVMTDGDDRVEVDLHGREVLSVRWNGVEVPAERWRRADGRLEVLDGQGEVAVVVPMGAHDEHLAERRLFQEVDRRIVAEMLARVQHALREEQLPPEGLDPALFEAAVDAAVTRTVEEEFFEHRVDRQDDGRIAVQIRLDPDDFAPALQREVKRQLVRQGVALETDLRRRLGAAVERAVTGMASFSFAIDAPLEAPAP
jgi:hypothetical protein